MKAIKAKIIDPYTNKLNCISRLYKEYCKHKKLIVAVDFDDTIFDFHRSGYSYDKIIAILKECQELDFYICIFTGSPPTKYDFITKYMENLGIKIHSINKNPFPMPFGNDGKMYYNILLDDRAGLGEAYEILRFTLDNIQIFKK